MKPILFQETWAAFTPGPLRRENSARGEYMTGLLPENPGGWYHAGKPLSGNPDGLHSPLRIVVSHGRPRLTKTADTPPWGVSLVLTPGPRPWHDYTVHAALAVHGSGPVGLVARYRSSRDFYAAVFEGGLLKLLRMNEGVPTELASAPFPAPRKAVAVFLAVQGDAITAKAGRTTLAARDGHLASGGIGIWAEGGLSCGPITVRAAAAELQRLERESQRTAHRLRSARKEFAPMCLLADVDVRGHALGRQLRLADLDGDGRCELLFAVPTIHPGQKGGYQALARLSALTLDDQLLWERGAFPRDADTITCDMPVQAADRGRGMEIVAAFADSLEVLDPRTGRTRQRTRTPRPPNMEPYWDEISSYFGSGHGDDLPRLIPDSLRLCNLTGRHPFGDLIVKDRYHCAWGFDGRSLKPLWRHRCNTGHYPYTCDLDGTGRDLVILGYSRLDHTGRLVGRLFLGDHPDACFAYRDRHGVRHILHPAGEAGLIDERSDGKVEEMHLGHVQHLSVANFDPARPGLERAVVMFHGAEGIVALLDEQNRLLRKTERYAAGAVCQPVNWTGDGRELIAFSPRLGDGGLWNEHFDLVVPFPCDQRPGKYMEVHDVLGLGVDQLVVWDEDRLQVYGPATLPSSTRRRYAPLRSWPNTSNYQVNFSLPRWLPPSGKSRSRVPGFRSDSR
jgi:hypothetical protein